MSEIHGYEVRNSTFLGKANKVIKVKGASDIGTGSTFLFLMVISVGPALFKEGEGFFFRVLIGFIVFCAIWLRRRYRTRIRLTGRMMTFHMVGFVVPFDATKCENLRVESYGSRDRHRVLLDYKGKVVTLIEKLSAEQAQALCRGLAAWIAEARNGMETKVVAAG